jgi:hypothetical protein
MSSPASVLTRALLATVVVIGVARAALPQEPETPLGLPLLEPTRLEVLMARQGTLILSGSSRVGAVRSTGGALVAVAGREVRDAQTGERARGISIEVSTTGGRDPERVSYVDLEELAPLLAALEAMARVQRTETALDRFEARYLTKGGLLVTVFDRGEGMKAAVASGWPGAAWTELEFGELQRLRQLLQRAREVLLALPLP